MMAFRFFGIIKSFVCLHQHLYCIWHTLLTVLYDHVGLAAGLACIRLCTFMCVYAHTNSKVKRVLDTNTMTRIVH